MTKESIYENNGEKISNTAAEALKQLIDRIERLSEEKAAIQADIKDVYSQAKSQGYDTAILRQVIKIRKMDEMEREENQQLLDLYLASLGMA